MCFVKCVFCLLHFDFMHCKCGSVNPLVSGDEVNCYKFQRQILVQFFCFFFL